MACAKHGGGTNLRRRASVFLAAWLFVLASVQGSDDVLITAVLTPPTTFGRLRSRQGTRFIRIFPIKPRNYGVAGTKIDEVKLIADSLVQAELELGSEWASKLADFELRHTTSFAKLRQSCEKRRAEAVRLKRDMRKEGEARQLLRQNYLAYLEHRKTVFDDLEKLLPPRKLTRLYQLEMRRRICCNGIVTALVVDNGLSQAVQLSEEELQDLAAEVRRLRTDVVTRSMPLFIEFMDEIDKVLQPRQRARLLECVEQEDLQELAMVEHLIWQCNYGQQVHLREADLPLEAADGIPLSIGPSGQLEAGFPDGDTLMRLRYRLQQTKELSIDDVQYEAMDPNRSPGVTAALKNTMKLYEDWERGKIAYPEFVEKLRASHIKKERAEWKNLQSILSARQLEQARTFIYADLLFRRGIVPSLVDGSLGHDLRLHDSQKERIRKIAKGFVPRFEKLSRRLEAHVWGKLLLALPVRARQRLARLVGPPPATMPGAPNLILSPIASLPNLELVAAKFYRKMIDEIKKELEAD